MGETQLNLVSATALATASVSPCTKVLTVDDTPLHLVAYETMLGDLGADLVTATSGAQALACLARDHFCLVVLDVQMPQMNGIETAEKIRHLANGHDVPIIFTTDRESNSNEELAAACYKLGAVDLITRPLNHKRLRSKVRVFIELANKTHKLVEQAQQLQESCVELRRSNQEFQDFAHAASHDLKAPLRQITGFSELLQIKLAGDSGTQVILEQVVGGAGRMRALIDHLLLYSRAGRGNLQSAPTDLGAVVEEVLTDMTSDILTSEARISVDTLPIVDGDRPQLYQVIQNLLSNAIKYCPAGVPPVVDISWQELPEEETAPRRCLLKVKDHGIGFPQTRLDEVFQPFRRLVGASEYNGCGIGLATARRIVERHGGSLTATSRVNHGSTFSLTLPFVHSIRPGPSLAG